MKKLLIAVSLLTITSASLFAQKAMTRTGKITFDATTPTSPEKISGIDKQVACAMDSKTGHIQFQAQIKDFKFEKALMEDHFNENYMESSQFPKAEFKGYIKNVKEIDFSKDGKYPANFEGTLTIHGVAQKVTTTGQIEIAQGKPTITGEFSVKIKDFGIKGLYIGEKIANEAKIRVNCKYQN